MVLAKAEVVDWTLGRLAPAVFAMLDSVGYFLTLDSFNTSDSRSRLPSYNNPMLEGSVICKSNRHRAGYSR